MRDRACPPGSFADGMLQQIGEIGALAFDGKANELPADSADDAACRFARCPEMRQIAVDRIPR